MAPEEYMKGQSDFDKLLLQLLAHAPDKNEPLPLSNRPETIYGTTISLLIISWMAVLFRLWVRLKVVKEPGWDDLFVFASACFNTVATVCVCLSIQHGFGTHYMYLVPQQQQDYLFLFWLANNLYMTESMLIKISLLLQYLRIFKSGAMRWTCIVLIALVTMWGLGFSFSGWFSCNPVRGAWDRSDNPKCFGFGFGRLQGFITAFIAHSATNMTFDIAIFVVPMVLFRTPQLRLKNALAMAGVFTFGAIVVATAIWRLHGIRSSRAATYPYVDFTWWATTPIILTCLEIDLAIICASMPIFWPVLEKSLTSIFVSFEVQVEEENTTDYGLAYELEHRKCAADGSVKSSGTSTHELTEDGEADGDEMRREFTVGVDPLSEEAKMGGLRTQIKSTPKPKWEI